MDEEKRAQLFVDLYKQQMEHYHHTQTIEWKANFGVWTLLAGAIYLAKERFVSIPPCYALIILGIAPAIHGFWLYKVLASEQTDKKFWVRYRQEALLLLRSTPVLPDEQQWERGIGTTILWLVVEVGVTFLLWALFLFLATRN